VSWLWTGRLLLRFGAAYAVLIAVAVCCEGPLNRAMVPFAELGLAAFQPELQVRAVSADRGRLKAEVLIGPRGASRGKREASVVANADQMLVGPLLTFSAVLAWRFSSSRKKAAALVLGALLVLTLAAHDISSAMALGIRASLGDEPGALARLYSFFLDSGGCQLLALASAGAAIQLVELAGATATRRAPAGDTSRWSGDAPRTCARGAS
jgi:hypothetical protein